MTAIVTNMARTASDIHVRFRTMAGLSLLPMAGASLGAWFDESAQLGFTTWRSACRAAGLRFSSLAEFTMQLLPTAVLGLLAGGLALLLISVVTRAVSARHCLAAHAGCALSLPLGLLLCASPLPVPLMLVSDVAVSALAATWLLRTPSRFSPVHP
jgi:hypothetical protein